MNYVDWKDIPMFTVCLEEAHHESQSPHIRYHWKFKDHEEYFNCTHMNALPMTRAVAAPFLDHVPVWQLDHPIKPAY